MNVNQLIIDYGVICDKRCEVLDFADFIIPRWLRAHRRAVELADSEVKAAASLAEALRRLPAVVIQIFVLFHRGRRFGGCFDRVKASGVAQRSPVGLQD
jgi:hypothetical protein